MHNEEYEIVKDIEVALVEVFYMREEDILVNGQTVKNLVPTSKRPYTYLTRGFIPEIADKITVPVGPNNRPQLAKVASVETEDIDARVAKITGGKFQIKEITEPYPLPEVKAEDEVE